jgi:hypothetical protein
MTSATWVMSVRATVMATATLMAGAPAAAQDVGPQPVRYDGFKQVHVQARTIREHQTVLALTHEVMTCSGSGVGWFDVAMSPEQYAAFVQTGIPHDVVFQDLQGLFDAERAEVEQIKLGDQPGFFDTYHTLGEINLYIEGLAAAHPTLAVVSSAGKTLQNRDMMMIHLVHRPDVAEEPSPAADRELLLRRGHQPQLGLPVGPEQRLQRQRLRRDVPRPIPLQ